ncbi:tRNA(Ile)-lysidine synthase [Bacteroidales bacterium Barb7]|nr:tRNA(Ile)-lysidine synthase [Bacteroidales bacterium Barb7]
MLNTVRTYISEHRLLPEIHQPVLVGLSGGADSVALLALLVRLRYHCIAAHCNFHLRGAESDRDEAFAAKVAADHNTPFHTVHFDTAAYAKQHRLSIETAARNLRYEWFENLRLSLNAQAVAVAHHRDDSVETLLLNLLRGSGIHGLTGIHPRNGFVVRPLLSLSRHEITEWLDQQGCTYITDSTNLSDEYTRNFLRLRILPLLEQINPAVKQTIVRTAGHLSDAALLYDRAIQDAALKVRETDTRLSIPALLNCPAPETVLYELLKPFNFTRPVSREIFLSLNGTSGKTFYSASNRLIKDRDCLLLSPLPDKQTTDTYTITAEEDTAHLPLPLSIRKIPASADVPCGKDNRTAWFDSDKITFPLLLRRWRKGDWFVPFGMKGKKKLSDYFSDRKYSRIQKGEAWLLCSGENILWIVGERADNRFRTDNTTTHILYCQT